MSERSTRGIDVTTPAPSPSTSKGTYLRGEGGEGERREEEEEREGKEGGEIEDGGR